MMYVTGRELLVSLIVPVFNAEDIFAVKCLDSILNQTYRNLEVILIDDGSTDNSLAICHSYAEN
jgi:glycosyltransferase involved in cell wall biosynthesis